MNAPTIAEAKQAEPESLWAFLGALPGTMEAQMLYALLLAGLVGMVGNYLVKWAKQEIDGSLALYLFSTHVRGTVLSVSVMIGAAITAITAGIFTASTGEFVGWGTVLWIGVTNGFAVDAIANKGHRKEWTPTERAEKLSA